MPVFSKGDGLTMHIIIHTLVLGLVEPAGMQRKYPLRTYMDDMISIYGKYRFVGRAWVYQCALLWWCVCALVEMLIGSYKNLLGLL